MPLIFLICTSTHIHVRVQVTRANGTVAYRAKECNFQIPFKSVLLARSEAKFLGKDISDTVNALWKIKQTIEVTSMHVALDNMRGNIICELHRTNSWMMR